MQMGTRFNRLPEFFPYTCKTSPTRPKERLLWPTNLKMQEHKAKMVSERVGKKKTKPIKFPSNTNNSPEVQGHQAHETVLVYFISHLLDNCKLKEKCLTDGRCSKNFVE